MIVAKQDKLTKMRIENGMTKSALAKELELDHSVIVRAEQRKGVRPQTAKRICTFFKVSFDEMFDITELEEVQ